MARVAPASWSFWAMPQAMERLLASPKTTAVLPAKSIMLILFLGGPCSGLCGEVPGPPHFRISAGARPLAPKVDQIDGADRAAEEAWAEALDLFDGVGSEEPEDWMDWCWVWRGAEVLAQMHDKFVGRGFGGIDDPHAWWNNAFDEGLE